MVLQPDLLEPTQFKYIRFPNCHPFSQCSKYKENLSRTHGHDCM